MNAQMLFANLPKELGSILETAKTCLSGGQLYVVGGLVRDVLLGVHTTSHDLDLGVAGAHASEIASCLQMQLGGSLTYHETFGTCTLDLGHILVDIATARREHYDPPGTLPIISFGTIADDLARRDFSVNALALRLQPEPFTLLDFHGGLQDIQTKQLRVLHPDSFSDDPTRIVRGARLAGRLGFRWEESTRLAISKALASPHLKNVSEDRFKRELELTLAEPQVTPALEQLENCNALSVIFGLTPSTLTARLDVLRQRGDVPAESYLLTLLLMMSTEKLEHWLDMFNYSPRYLASVQRLQQIQQANAISGAQFTKLSEAEKMTVRTFSDALDNRIHSLVLQFKEQRLTGKDVLDLGLKSGPEVGNVLAHVARARDAGEVDTFEDELALATQLVQTGREELLERELPERELLEKEQREPQ